jgi:hypothetical protein
MALGETILYYLNGSVDKPPSSDQRCRQRDCRTTYFSSQLCAMSLHGCWSSNV